MLDSKLLTLVTLAEKKNFTKAAEALSLTQPAVSHQLKQLENELNTTLVIRTKNEVIFTEEGKIAVNFAKKILGLYAKMTSSLEDKENHITNLRIGITHTSESNIMMVVLAKVSTLMDDLNITIITDTINNLYDKLENYEIDLAIIEGKVNTEKYNSLLLDTDSLVCILSKENKLAKKGALTLEDLKREKMILRLPDSATRTLFDSTLVSMNESVRHFNVILEVDNIDTIKSLVRKNLGISILAKSACLDEINKGKLKALPIENLSMIRETNIVYKKTFDYSKILETIYSTYQKLKAASAS